MLFESLRKNRHLKLAAIFGFAAASATMGLPREKPETIELRQLAREYAAHGPYMSEQRFERFTNLMRNTENKDTETVQALNAAGFCAHGSGSSGPASAAAAACPVARRRIEKGDLSHLLAINHWV